jgi:hypothetical protein
MVGVRKDTMATQTPFGPDATNEAVALRAEPVTRFLLALTMFGGMFLSRFALVVDQRELSLSLLVTLASITGLIACGRVRISVPRFILFTASIAATVTAATLGGAGRVSINSYLLLVVLYFGYIFVIAAGDGTYKWSILTYRNLSFFLAVAGIFQFFGQILLPGTTLFTFEGYIPASYLDLSFHLAEEIPSLPGYYKSNGFFLLEPAVFGQLMALSVIVELLLFPVSWYLVIFVISLFLSFSGTGLLLCTVFAPLLLFRRDNPTVLLLACALAILVFFLSDRLPIDAYTGRVGEFSATHSSAFARFLSPFYLFGDYLLPSARNFLFGLGPGSINAFFKSYYIVNADMMVDIHDPTWGKLFLEYGLVGTLPFVVFVLYCFFADAREMWLSSALFFTYLVLGGYLLDTHLNALILSLVVWHNLPRATQASSPGRQTWLVPRTVSAPMGLADERELRVQSGVLTGPKEGRSP